LQEDAREQNKPLLLVFSGSDWCRPCILFDQNVLQTEEFKALLANKLLFYKADLPRNKKLLSKEQRVENEQLAEKYNQQGAFPMLVLFNAQGEVIKSKKGALLSIKELKAWLELD
jgi:thioredoxin-related protein